MEQFNERRAVIDTLKPDAAFTANLVPDSFPKEKSIPSQQSESKPFAAQASAAESVNLPYSEQKAKLFEDYRNGLLNMEQFNERRAIIDKLKPNEGHQYQGRNYSLARTNKGLIIALIACVCIAVLAAGGFYFRGSYFKGDTLSENDVVVLDHRAQVTPRQETVELTPIVTPAAAPLQFDLLERRELINYRVPSTWRKGISDDGIYWFYHHADGFLTTVATEAPFEDFFAVDMGTLNKALDLIVGEYLKVAGFHDVRLSARTVKNGIPVQPYEAKINSSGNVYLSKGFVFVYGNYMYVLSATYPVTGNTQFFFSSALAQIMDNLVIEKYPQAALERIAGNAANANNNSAASQIAARQQKTVEPTPAATPLQFDLLERRERIHYRVPSAWRKGISDDGTQWHYYPEKNADSFLMIDVNLLEGFFTVDNALNKALDSAMEVFKKTEGIYDFHLSARTVKSGVPVQPYEAKIDNSGNVYLAKGFVFVYGNHMYMLWAFYPVTGDSQLFASALAKVMDNLVIEKYSQAALARIAGNADNVNHNSAVSQIAARQQKTVEPVPTVAPPQYDLRQVKPAREIFDEYSQKLRAATPRLLDEYRVETAQNRLGIEGLAEIINAKVEKLAQISNEGVSKMAENMTLTSAGSYMKWGMKLNGVYMEEAGKIMSAYVAPPPHNLIQGMPARDILNEYSQKLRAATPRLLNEYRAEAARNRRGIEGLAEIINAKVEKLAQISNEGVSKLAENITRIGAKYYMESGMKLNGVYMEEAGKIWVSLDKR